ncbi:MAG: hypothetical protein VKJ04_11775 [Vampirovibrionales bacterium]|nr:hypothetical protein [Vampirovibrionales bacterium]
MVAPVSGLGAQTAIPSLTTTPQTAMTGGDLSSFSPAALSTLTGFLSGPLDSQMALSPDINPLGGNRDFFQMMTGLMQPLQQQAALSLAELQQAQMLQQQQVQALQGGAIIQPGAAAVGQPLAAQPGALQPAIPTQPQLGLGIGTNTPVATINNIPGTQTGGIQTLSIPNVAVNQASGPTGADPLQSLVALIVQFRDVLMGAMQGGV